MSNKKTTDSERNSPAPHKKPLTEEQIDNFQHQLTRERILDIWKKMREGGNSKDGIVTREKFKHIFTEYFGNKSESLSDAIFERFKKKDFTKDDRYDKRRMDEKRPQITDPDKGEIDLHDLVVSLAILSNLGYDDKLELVFDLTDIDEDGCLSPDDVCKMILAIERNFARESSFIDPDNASSLNFVATRKALRRFNYIFLNEYQEGGDYEKGGKGRKDKLLGHFKDFLAKLNNKKNLYQNLLPKNYSLKSVLDYEPTEKTFSIHKNEEDHFRRFRAELHNTIWGVTRPATKHKSLSYKKEEVLKIQNKEPGEVITYGVRVPEEELRYVEIVSENLKQKESIIQERSIVPEHKKRLKDMKEKNYPKLEEIMGTKYEKMLKKKESHLPAIGKHSLDHDVRQTKMEIPDLSSMIEKRVERLKKEYKYLDPNYKQYLLNKLTSSMNDKSKESSPQIMRKTQPYKFLM